MSSKVTAPKNTKLERSGEFRHRRHEQQHGSVSNDSETSHNSSDTVLKQSNWEEAQRLIAHRALSRSTKSDRGKLLRKEQVAEMVKRLKSAESNLQKNTELQKETQKKLNESNRKIEKLSTEKKQLERAIYQFDHEKKEILRKYKAENFTELIESKEKTIKYLTFRCGEMHNQLLELTQQLKKSSEENFKIKSLQEAYKKKYLKYKAKLTSTCEKNAQLAFTVQQEISRREDFTSKKKKEYDGKCSGNAMGKKTLLEQLQQPDPIPPKLSCLYEVDELAMKMSNVGDPNNRFNSVTGSVVIPQKVEETTEPFSVMSYFDTIRQKLNWSKKEQSDNCYFDYPSFDSTCEADVFRMNPTPMGLPDYLPTNTKTDFNSARNIKTDKQYSDTSYKTADEDGEVQCNKNVNNSSTGHSRTRKQTAKASSSKSMTHITQSHEKQGPSKKHNSSRHKTERSERVSKSAKTPMDIFAEIFGKGFETLATYAPVPENVHYRNRFEMPPPSSSYQKTSRQTSKDWQKSHKMHLDLPNEAPAKLKLSPAAHRRNPVRFKVAKNTTASEQINKKEDLTPRLTTTIRLHTPGSQNRHIVTVNGKVLVFEPPAPSGWSTLQHEEPLTNPESFLLSSFEDSPEMKSLWRDLAIAYARTDLRQGKSVERIPFVADVKTVYNDFNETDLRPLQVSRTVDAILLADNTHKSKTKLIESPSLDSNIQFSTITESRKSVSTTRSLCLEKSVGEEGSENLNALSRESLSSLSLEENVEEERNENLNAIPRSSLSSLSLEENNDEERNENLNAIPRSSLSSLSLEENNEEERNENLDAFPPSSLSSLNLEGNVEEKRNENLYALPHSSSPSLNLAGNVEEEINENVNAIPRSSLSSLSLDENVEEEINENLYALPRSSLSSLSDTIDSDSEGFSEDYEQQWEASSSSTFRVISDESSLHSASSVTSVMLEQLLSESLDLMKTFEEQDSGDLMKENEIMTESNTVPELLSIKKLNL